MTDLAPLGFSIDSTPIAQASADLDRLSASALRAEQAAGNIGRGFDATASGATRAQQAFGQAASASSLLAAQVGLASASLGNYVVNQNAATQAANDTTAALARQAAGWRAMSDAGRQAVQMFDRNAEAQRKLSALSSTGNVPIAPGKAEPGRLNAYQAQNLFYQGSDIVASAASGMSPLTILLQQGGQIAPTFAGPGGATVSGALKQAGEAAAGMAARVGIAGGALGVLGGAAALAIAAQRSYASTQMEAALATAGVGRVSGATAATINATASAFASAGGVSVREARSMASEFAATGRIGTEFFGGLIQTTRDYALTTGQEVPDAAKELAQAFADPAKGADALNAKLGFLNDTTRESIQRMQAQGDRLGAQQALFSAYSGSLVDATEMTTAWGRTTHAVGTIISDIWDAIGQRVDKVVTGGTLDDQLAAAKKTLSNAQVAADGGFGLFSSKDVERAQGEVDKLQSRIDARTRRAQQAQTAQNSLLLGNLMRQLEPENERLKQLQDRVELVRKAISDPLKFGLEASTLAPVENAFDRMSRQLRAMRDDMEQFGTVADAAAVRVSNFARRTATFDPFGRSVAQANETYETKLRDRGLDPNVTADQVRARFNPQLQNDLLGPKELQAITNAREAALRDVASRDALAIIKNNEIETARIQALTSSTARSGLLNTVPDRYRQMFVDAAAQTGLPLDIGIALARQENAGFNPTIVNRGLRGESHATGLMQLQPGTARQMGVTDITDPMQNLMGGFRYAKQQLDAANGDVAEMYRRYHDGPAASGPASVFATRGAANIQRMLNMPTTSAQVLEGDNRERDLQAQRRQAEIMADLYGRNGVLFDAQTRKEQMLQEARNRGIVVDDAYIASVDKIATGVAETARRLASTRLGADLSFEREQLGRSASDQSAYSRARSQFGDTSTPEAQLAIANLQDLNNLKEARSTFQDTFGGMVTSLSHGTSGLQVFTSTLNRLGDKAISIGTDALGAALFGGSKDSGGIGGLLGGLLKSGGGVDLGLTSWMPKFANGGVMTSIGPVPLNRYAMGGIASSPQMAIFGEGRGPEAYVPLPDGRSIPVSMKAPANQNAGSTYTNAPSISIDARGSTMTEGQIRGVVVQAIAASSQEQFRTQAERAEAYRRMAG